MALFEKLDLCVHGAGYVRFYYRGTIFGMLVGWMLVFTLPLVLLNKVGMATGRWDGTGTGRDCDGRTDGTGRNGTGRNGTERDGTGRTGQDGTRQQDGTNGTERDGRDRTGRDRDSKMGHGNYEH